MSQCSDEELAKIPSILRALANPHRLRIFRRLACCKSEPLNNDGYEGHICACVGVLGKDLSLAPSTVSHHIKVLSEAGIIEMARKGQMIECRINPSVVKLLASYFQGLIEPGL